MEMVITWFIQNVIDEENCGGGLSSMKYKQYALEALRRQVLMSGDEDVFSVSVVLEA